MLILAQEATTAVSVSGGKPIEQIAPILFYGCAFLTVISSWCVVMSQNIVRMAVYLLLTLIGVAGLYFMMSAELLAAVQLIVYAGGTLILIVFGVMLTGREAFGQMKVHMWELVCAPLIGIIIAALLGFALMRTDLPPEAAEPVGGYGTVEDVGKGLLSTFVVPFEVAAVLLLVVMIGAAYMARQRVTPANPGN